MKAKYINPFTDYGFKKIFGEEASKPLLIDFLNALLPLNSPITSLSFKNIEQLGAAELDRRAVFDLYCESAIGERFIVELQKAKQNFFKDRTVFYSTFPIREQADRGTWDFRLNPVYCVGVLDFTFDDYATEPERSEVVHTIKLKDQHGRVFYDKLTYVYLEMPNFVKGEHELASRLDQWLYFIRHLEDFQAIPAIFRDAVFEVAFEKAAIARMGPAEMDAYEQSLKYYRDLNNVIDTAYSDGKQEGLQEGMARGIQQGLQQGLEQGALEAKLTAARNLKAMGLHTTQIAQALGLTPEEIEAL